MISCNSLRVALPLTALLCMSQYVFAQGAAAVDSWLRGSSQDLQMRLHGELQFPEGALQTDAQVSVTLRGKEHDSEPETRLAAEVDGNRYQIWLPVNRMRWYAMSVQATAGGELAASQSIKMESLRTAARDGLTLQLQPPSRYVAVAVTDEGQGVEAAHVCITFDIRPQVDVVTDASGVVRVPLYGDDAILAITAWTDDHRVGGCSPEEGSSPASKKTSYSCELDASRHVTLRTIDAAGSPVSDLAVRMIAVKLPAHDFLGAFPHDRRVTDGRGQAVFGWYPAWKEVDCFTAVISDDWTQSGDLQWDGDVATLTVKPMPRRELVAGKVSITEGDPAGIAIRNESFQHPREGYSDEQSTFCDGDGNFWVNAFPDATYVTYVADDRLVSSLMDWTPISRKAGAAPLMQLDARAGEQAVVLLTTGRDRQPLADTRVRFLSPHNFRYRVGSEEKNGTISRAISVKTDEQGMAAGAVLPGKLKIIVINKSWILSEEVDVAAGEKTTVRLHRQYTEGQIVRGRLEAENADVLLADARVYTGAVDGQSNEKMDVAADAEGSFSFTTTATRFGVYAETADRSAAGFALGADSSQILEVRLLPTIDYHGRLLDSDDRPLIGWSVNARIDVRGERRYDLLYATEFKATELAAITDREGRYVLRGLPARMPVRLRAAPPDNEGESTHLGEVYLEPGEDRPPAVKRIDDGSVPSEPPALPERFAKTLRDCQLNGYRMLVIRGGSSAAAKEFAREQFLLRPQDAAIASYLHFELDAESPGGAADAATVVGRDWPHVQPTQIFAAVLSPRGEEIAREVFEVDAENAAERCRQFIEQHATPQTDAAQKWEEAFAQAAKTGRRVWAVEGGRFCGPCFRFARWVDDQRETLERDYVFFKVDTYYDLSGGEVSQRITRGGQHGVPFHAIFDADGMFMVDSVGPLGNFGMPSSFEDRKQLRHMLQATRVSLSDQDIDSLLGSLPQ